MGLIHRGHLVPVLALEWRIRLRATALNLGPYTAQNKRA